MPAQSSTPTAADYVRLHLRFGWGALFLFTILGLGLETFHGFKTQAYLSASNETRRLMWTLAHAHGTLLSLINIIFAASLHAHPGAERFIRTTSLCLRSATVLLPLGFFLGGVVTYGGDPGLGILFVPIGAALLLLAIVTLYRAAKTTSADRRIEQVHGGKQPRRPR